jgi:hypothetical protein
LNLRSTDQSDLGSLALQPKLVIGDTNDPLESEAEHTAERVMRMPDGGATRAISKDNDAHVRRKCNSCEEEEKETKKLSRMGAGNSRQFDGVPVPHSIHDVLNSPGTALDRVTRAYFEPRFAHDFSHVRVHTSPRAAESARAIGAAAYTVGSHIVFGANRYDPHSNAGGKLLAHELAHTIQQQGPSPKLRRRPQLGNCRPVQDDLRPTAPWEDLQRGYKARCGSAVSDVGHQLGQIWGDIKNLRTPHSPHLPDIRSSIDCACATMPPRQAALAALPVVTAAGPLAAKLYLHFLGASGAPMTIDVADMIGRSRTVRAKIRQSIRRGGMSGTTHFEQEDYGDRELQFAYGAIDCVQWQALPPAKQSWRSDPATQIKVSMLDYYEFHPKRLGMSQCSHAACVEEVARGEAKNFWTSGDAVMDWRTLQQP